jgi:hypothetical protein
MPICGVEHPPPCHEECAGYTGNCQCLCCPNGRKEVPEKNFRWFEREYRSRRFVIRHPVTLYDINGVEQDLPVGAVIEWLGTMTDPPRS